MKWDELMELAILHGVPLWLGVSFPLVLLVLLIQSDTALNISTAQSLDNYAYG